MTILMPGKAPADGPAPVPPAYAAAAKAKLKRDRETFAAFRRVDQEEHERAHRQRLTAAVAAEEEELRLWRVDLAELEPEAAAALAAFRAADDRAREAREFARLQRGAYERTAGKGSAQEETEALIRADTADTVAADADRIMQQKQAELTDSDRGLAEAREGLAASELRLDKVRKAAEVPAGTAAISDTTMRACAAFMQRDEIWDTLTGSEKRRLNHLAEPRAVFSMGELLQSMRAERLAAEGIVA